MKIKTSVVQGIGLYFRRLGVAGVAFAFAAGLSMLHLHLPAHQTLLIGGVGSLIGTFIGFKVFFSELRLFNVILSTMGIWEYVAWLVRPS